MSTQNTMTVARVRRACLAASALIILSASQSASLAQSFYGPRATFGAHYQQTSLTTSTDGITEGGFNACNGQSRCNVLFQRVPQQQRLLVRHVSCMGGHGAGVLRRGFLSTRKGQAFPVKRSHLAPVNTTDGSWIVSSPVMHLVEPREHPVVHLDVNTSPSSWGVECTISGELLEP